VRESAHQPYLYVVFSSTHFASTAARSPRPSPSSPRLAGVSSSFLSRTWAFLGHWGQLVSATHHHRLLSQLASFLRSSLRIKSRENYFDRSTHLKQQATPSFNFLPLIHAGSGSQTNQWCYFLLISFPCWYSRQIWRYINRWNWL
jgi:hypothetical protein